MTKKEEDKFLIRPTKYSIHSRYESSMQICSLEKYILSIEDDHEGREYLSVTDETGSSICIDAEDWPVLKNTIELILGKFLETLISKEK